jgi:glycosyltransferase involved in cell wall biosynthesis
MNRRIAVSSAVAKHYAQNLGIATECFDLIPNGLPIPESSSKPNQRIKEKIKIVALGRLVPEKGYEYLLKAFALINQKQPDRFQLQIIGGGPLDQELRALARSLQLEVLFFGSMAYEEAQIELANADIFVTASIFEGFGLSVAEAMLAEVPVVVTDIGGIRDIVRPDFAEIVLPRQPESIAQAILRVAELSQTEQDQRVKKARQFVEKNFSVKSVASRLANAYQKQLRELH